jgi:hypothetical protein
MRKWIILSLAMWFGIGIGMAYADVHVFATIDKDKDKFVLERIEKVKLVELHVAVDVVVIKAAESDALVNQRNFANEACENCAEKRDIIENSGNTNSGIVTVNQAAGNMNNQASAVSVAIDVRTQPPGGVIVPQPDPDDRGFAEAQAAADQRNDHNLVESVNLLFRDTLISGSFNGNTGVVHVNQAAGNMANQANVLSLAVAFTPGVALSEADLGQVNAFNTVFESDAGGAAFFGVHKSATITASVNGNTGIIGVNQSSGNMANQANVVSFAATQSPVTP